VQVELDPGWLKAQFFPTDLWHEEHVPFLCPEGRVWHEVQVDFDPGWENAHVRPGFLWQDEQAPDLCFAGRLWHAAQSPEVG
jgi:hypothetical protein